MARAPHIIVETAFPAVHARRSAQLPSLLPRLRLP